MNNIVHQHQRYRYRYITSTVKKCVASLVVSDSELDMRGTGSFSGSPTKHVDLDRFPKKRLNITLFHIL